MGGKRGCCIARRAGGANDMSIINMIMLGFRPIAPKPAGGGSVPGGSTPANNNNVLVANGKAKMKCVRVSSRKRCKRMRKRTKEVERKDEVDKTVVTLQLLPEKTDSPVGGSWCNLDRTVTTRPVDQDPPVSVWLNFNISPIIITDNMTGSRVSDRAVVKPPRRQVESRVTVECVTDTCMDGIGMGLGSTDVERRKNLEVDTCPGFISDGLNMVQWANEAYRKMVGREEGEAEMVVGLVVMEKLPYLYPAFACRVRLQYTWRDEKYSQMLPCDAWKMDSGGFAWRLDVNAALSLGR